MNSKVLRQLELEMICIERALSVMIARQYGKTNSMFIKFLHYIGYRRVIQLYKDNEMDITIEEARDMVLKYVEDTLKDLNRGDSNE